MKYFSLTLLLFLLLFPLHAFAQDISQAPVATATAMASNSAETQVNYFLPYPGLLPGTLLYPLKMVRDAAVGFLISDPVKKAKFDLLQADKRVGAAQMLEENGDAKKLAVPTFSKAANYFEQAITETKQAKGEGMQVNDLVNTLHSANEKYQEIALDMERGMPAQERGLLMEITTRLKMLGQRVNQLMPKK